MFNYSFGVKVRSWIPTHLKKELFQILNYFVITWPKTIEDHTHVHTDGVSTSVIDHFLVSQ